MRPIQLSFVMRERLDAGPTPKDGICPLRGADFKRILASEFRVLRSFPAVDNLLYRLGSAYLRPRPRHRQRTGNVPAEAGYTTAFTSQHGAIARDANPIEPPRVKRGTPAFPEPCRLC